MNRQVFPRWANVFAAVSIIGGALLAAGLATLLYLYVRSPAVTGVGNTPEQPIPFYHNVHVLANDIDCRYCHTSVETSSFAGIPSSQLCMNCHSQILADAPILEPLRQSFNTGMPIEWNRVHRLPDHAYFDHSIHVAKGVGCETCHGRVDQMLLVGQVESLQMSWCLECHREPERFVRPREEVYTMGWQPPQDQAVLGAQLVSEYNIASKTDCSTCHR